MMSLQLAAKALKGVCHGVDTEFSSVSTDTRNIEPGDLYIALQGENFDGHNYIDQALQAGAVAAIVHKDIAQNLPYIKVEDTRKALGALSALWRQSFNGKVVAITGSNGKTTVKEMLAAILSEQGEVLATQGNFNNDIGLPLTMLHMKNEDYGVIEMGANHIGEIAYLTSLAQPDIAVITNAGASHLEGFGSLEGVAIAKGEIYQGLSEDGVAVINKDDSFSEYWHSICDCINIVTFSMCDKTSNVYGEWVQKEQGVELKVYACGEVFSVQLKLHGRHNAMNALAAICVAHVFSVASEKIITALSRFEPVKGRLNIHRVNTQFCVIDDSYNANPASLEAGINVLKSLPGEHWLVMGDMGELGKDEKRLHFSAGIKARELGVDCLLATGNASRAAVEAFGEKARFFESRDELVSYIKQSRQQELGVLVKGSRFMHMENIVESLIEGAV
ncbi:UDP-N-acetylmuramoyl-tripeptide--D-alanyl-D-alanine ligase [hydrothermal vent metagenome]|uniref:UDP-MurNAc-pentapeptide synthetase n=1 Tax=hydrothermal vent metagenome TaxID=652676 RepID=A0A3B0WYM1_9ZZZZ